MAALLAAVLAVLARAASTERAAAARACCPSAIAALRARGDVAAALAVLRGNRTGGCENQRARTACVRLHARLETTECRFLPHHPVPVLRAVQATKALGDGNKLARLDPVHVLSASVQGDGAERTARALQEASATCWRSGTLALLLARARAHAYVALRQGNASPLAIAKAADRLYVAAQRASALRPHAPEAVGLLAAAIAAAPGQPWATACPGARFCARRCTTLDPDAAGCARVARALTSVCGAALDVLGAASSGNRAAAFEATVRLAWALQTSRAQRTMHFAAAEGSAMRSLCAHAVAGAIAPETAAWASSIKFADGAGVCAAAMSGALTANTPLSEAVLHGSRAVLAAAAANAAARRAGKSADAAALLQRARAELWSDVAETEAMQLKRLWLLAAGMDDAGDDAPAMDPAPLDATHLAEALPRLLFARFPNAVMHEEPAAYAAGAMDLPLLEAYVAHTDGDEEVTEAASALTGLVHAALSQARGAIDALESSHPGDIALIGTSIDAAREALPLDKNDDEKEAALRSFLKRTFRRRALEVHPDKARLLLERADGDSDANVDSSGVLSASVGAIVLQAGYRTGIDDEAVVAAYDIARKAYERLADAGIDGIGFSAEGKHNEATRESKRKAAGDGREQDLSRFAGKPTSTVEEEDSEDGDEEREWAFSYDRRDVDEDGFAEGEWVDPKTGERHSGREQTMASDDSGASDAAKFEAEKLQARKRAAARHRVRGLPPHCVASDDEFTKPVPGSLLRTTSGPRPVCLDGRVIVDFQPAARPGALKAAPPPVVVGGGSASPTTQELLLPPSRANPKGFRIALDVPTRAIRTTFEHGGGPLDVRVELMTNSIGLAQLAIRLGAPVAFSIPVVTGHHRAMGHPAGMAAARAVAQRLLKEEDSPVDNACAAQAVARLEVAVLAFLNPEASHEPLRGSLSSSTSRPSTSLVQLLTAAGIGLPVWPSLLRRAFVTHAPATWHSAYADLKPVEHGASPSTDLVDINRAFRLFIGATAAAHGAKERRSELLENFAGDAAERLWSAGESFATCLAADVVPAFVASVDSASNPSSTVDDTHQNALLQRSTWHAAMHVDMVRDAAQSASAIWAATEHATSPIPEGASLAFETKVLLPSTVTVSQAFASISRVLQISVMLDLVSDAGIALAQGLDMPDLVLAQSIIVLEADVGTETRPEAARRAWQSRRVPLPAWWTHRRVRDVALRVEVSVLPQNASSPLEASDPARFATGAAAALSAVRASWRGFASDISSDGKYANNESVTLGSLAAVRNLRIEGTSRKPVQVLVPNELHSRDGV